QRAIDDTEDRSRRSDSEREREHGDGRKARRPAQQAQRLARILDHVLDPAHAIDIPRILVNTIAAAERDQCATTSLVIRETLRAHQLLCFHLDVEAHLFVHLTFHVATTEEGAQTTLKPIAHHVASSTCSTAEENARHCLRSAANAFRPAAVRL